MEVFKMEFKTWFRVGTVTAFKAHLAKFWSHQAVNFFLFTTNLTGNRN